MFAKTSATKLLEYAGTMPLITLTGAMKSPRSECGADLTQNCDELIQQARADGARNFAHRLKHVLSVFLHRVAFNHHIANLTIGLQKLADDVDIV